jgi:hypothetical protein
MKGDIKMKKIIFAIAIVLTIGLAANAQGNDDFFRSWDNNDNNDRGPGIMMPGSESFGQGTNQPGAPLGTGLLIMTALGAGYAVAKRRKK